MRGRLGEVRGSRNVFQVDAYQPRAGLGRGNKRDGAARSLGASSSQERVRVRDERRVAKK